MWHTIVTAASVLATPILVASYVPQVIQLIKTRNTDGISLPFWFLLDSSLLCLFVLAVDGFIQTGSVGLMFSQGVNLILALFITGLIVWFRRKTVNRTEVDRSNK